MTKRPMNAGAEKWLNEDVQVLDHGKVILLDYMGSDEEIVNAARLSYGKGTKTVSENQGLINYLMRNRHTSPFEQCELKFFLKMPIFVARQLVRHRTASLNEYSMRYSEAVDEFYIPTVEQFRSQSKTNKQGSDEVTTTGPLATIAIEGMKSQARRSFDLYTDLLKLGLAREIARSVLPVSTYTTWYWKIDLHNLIHLLGLRLDSHAQYEIRVFAEQIAAVVKDAFPMVWNAFVDYRTESVSLSRKELEAIEGIVGDHPYKGLVANCEEAGLSKGEVRELFKKFKLTPPEDIL